MCFFFNDTATTEIYTLSLHDALPILASPHVAGAAAVFLSANPSAPPGQVAAALTSSATSGAVVGANGTPNLLLYASSGAATPTPPPTPAPTPTPTPPPTPSPPPPAPTISLSGSEERRVGT